MTNNSLLRVFYILIIIVGGVLLFFVGKPIPPEPPCIMCGSNIVNLGAIAEMILGVAALVVQGKTVNIMRG